MTPQALDGVHAWVAALATPSAVVIFGLILRRQLLRMHADMLRTLVDGVGRLERAMTHVAGELVSARRRLDALK